MSARWQPNNKTIHTTEQLITEISQALHEHLQQDLGSIDHTDDATSATRHVTHLINTIGLNATLKHLQEEYGLALTQH